MAEDENNQEFDVNKLLINLGSHEFIPAKVKTVI